MIELQNSTLINLRKHAEQCYPKESCGVVLIRRGREEYVPCRNIADSNEHFVMHPLDYADAEDRGSVIAIVHSHPNISPEPSQADRVGCETSGLPWVIVNWPTGAVRIFVPSGYKAPLIGRVFSHGILDCLTLIQDYYKEVLGITLPQYKREDEWWLKGKNLYLDLFEECGFVLADVNNPKEHDVLFMQVASKVPNHGAVYLGNGFILHHQMYRLSSRDVYGGWYRKITTHAVRHKDLLT